MTDNDRREPTPLERYVMIAQARGDRPRDAYVACPIETVRDYHAFARSWHRVKSWRAPVPGVES